MRLISAVSAAIASAALVVPAQALADTKPIEVGRDKPFKHKPSGIVVAANIAGGIPRAGVAQYDNKQLDVIVDYRNADQSEITTVYLFRNVTGDVPVWFDRIRRTMESGDRLGTIKVAIPPAAFTPAGQANPRALRAVYSASGAGFTSSAAAITETGEWYVAIRASSKSLTPDQLLARVEQTFASIQWPKEKASAPSAAPIADCTKPLAQGEDAQPVKNDLGAMILASALGAAVGNAPDEKTVAAPSRWCRDPYKIDEAGVYRPDDSVDSYLIAFQDAGRGVWVAPNGLAGILGSSDERSWMVESVDVDHRDGFGGFKTLPNIAQALWVSEKGARTYRASTWGKNKNIEINSDAMK